MYNCNTPYRTTLEKVHDLVKCHVEYDSVSRPLEKLGFVKDNRHKTELGP